MSATLSDVAYGALLAGAYDDATTLLQQALPAARKALNPHREALALSNLGLARLLALDIPASRRAFSESLEICLRTQFRLLVSEPLLGCAAVAGHAGDPGRAARLYGASQALRINAPHNRIDDVISQRFLAPARETLGETEWDDAARAGEQLDFPSAIGEARATPAPLPVAGT